MHNKNLSNNILSKYNVQYVACRNQVRSTNCKSWRYPEYSSWDAPTKHQENSCKDTPDKLSRLLTEKSVTKCKDNDLRSAK